MTSFSSLSLPAPLARAVEVLGFEQMTPVQEHAIPPLLEGKDVIAQARTGTGKTAAFGLALLARVDVDVARVQALVLCPTRELAEQVSAEIRRLARFIPNLRVVTLCGGVPVRTQTPGLQTPPHVVVGTPGRILDHLSRETMELGGLAVLVLDEADRMLDMGFKESIDDVVKQSSSDRQTSLFSATFPDEIRELSRSLQRSPLAVTVDSAPAEVEIEQVFFEVEPRAKMDALVALLLEHKPESALVFCHTRNDVRDVADGLNKRGFAVLALHGELEQRERDEVLLRFANKSVSVLVATDVAARGLDIKELSAVVSWELPTDPDVHVHRVGRTGRAGHKGLALALVAPREKERLARIDAGDVTWGRYDAALTKGKPEAPRTVTFIIEGGKRDKMRRGDVLGALTGDVGLSADAVGKIDITLRHTYVAIARERADEAHEGLKAKTIKGKAFRVYRM